MPRTMSQQLMEAVQVATSPFQYAMSTKERVRKHCACIAGTHRDGPQGYSDVY